jgi:Zn finger protein HypA/HybF involved in hydrogenase expression
MMTAEDERTYCEKCHQNFDDDGFDYRFDFPVCLTCASDFPECNNCGEVFDDRGSWSLICQRCEDRAIFYGGVR